ncbi:hypothetical protein C6N75_17980 [Streptomyces solincola]|uniref:Uncharacterized protein n=1 Tax=Streptomyces solincola TaxID=2100817 RepID=A0A2S9PU92_9ACTN|nr:hypothetical protein [Streptomyces solincola]PRH77907.1 hypothetical protein C6N75_17980 [Streptomyces solincola]
MSAQIGQDGSVSTLVTLKDATAPTEHRFSLHLPDGAQASVAEDGGVVAGDQDGELLGTFSSP